MTVQKKQDCTEVPKIMALTVAPNVPVSYLIWGGHFQQSFYSITFWVNLWVRIKKLLESRAAFTAFTQIHIHKYPLSSNGKN